MPVERLAAELGQDEYFPVAGMDAVADRNVDQPEAAGNRHGRFAADFGQGIKAAPLPAGHHDGNDFGRETLLFLFAKSIYQPKPKSNSLCSSQGHAVTGPSFNCMEAPALSHFIF
jgi:hypothetical protein